VGYGIWDLQTEYCKLGAFLRAPPPNGGQFFGQAAQIMAEMAAESNSPAHFLHFLWPETEFAWPGR